MNNQPLDISQLYSKAAKQTLAESLKLAAKLNLDQATPVILLNTLLKEKKVRQLISQLNLNYDQLNLPLPTKQSQQPMKVAFSPELKKIIFLAYQEAFLSQRSEITRYDLFITTAVELKIKFNLSQAQTLISHLSGGQTASFRTANLDQFTQNLTQQAAAGQLGPIVGRDKEVAQVIRILGRKTKSNAVLIGDAGVGKTAIIEGLALLIAQKKVPSLLQDVQILSLSLTSLMAGATFQGDLEKRIQSLIQEIKTQGSVILFIDELHMIVDAGAAGGAMTAANILKPALARGELHVVGATTHDEYRQHIEKDPALSRRFEPVKVDEPNEADALIILTAVAKKLSQHHQVKITPQAIQASVTLSKRYIQDRRLPDKAIDLLDEATSASQLANKSEVTEDDIRTVLSQRTGIPMQKLTEKDSLKLLNLEQEIKKQIIGQDQAVNAITDVIKRARAGLKDPNRPIGSFLLLGPTGVGKTELAKVLTQVVYNDEKAMVRLDMSEFTESHTADRLMGAPPGYVGYEEGGQLTNPIRQRPYSLVLLDEVEKAHPRLFDVFLQVLEDGRLTDAQGHAADFKNTIIIMTSNIDVSQFLDSPADQTDRTELMKALSHHFRPEFLNRIDDIILMNPLSINELKQIAKLLIIKVNQRLKDKNISISVTEAALNKLVQAADTKHFGARPLKRLIQEKIEEPLAEKILRGELQSGQTITITPEEI
ncbi:ATP-dependent Clp protease ATP-binding subunit [Patescibacteria group bacterium]|nr:ATP-dependent Clp protease ATP-binding subunit [Patescibacteria group bacterium]MBU1931501.1 ATP-dependent Clp protease ATP-binding subunit [Patescibacteria group bacterium]